MWNRAISDVEKGEKGRVLDIGCWIFTPPGNYAACRDRFRDRTGPGMTDGGIWEV